MTLEFYSPRKDFFHNLSPPTKIIFVVTTSVTALALQQPLANGVLLALLVAIALYVRIPRYVASIFMRTAIVVGAVLVISWLFFTHYGHPVFRVLDGIYFYDESISLTISVLFRLWALLVSTMTFLVITRENEFISGLRMLKVPFSISLMLALVLRFIPLLYAETQQIREAQMARGLELEKIGLFDRIKKFVAIIIPWLVISLKTVSSFTLAISSRGFEVNTGVKRTFFRKPQMRWRDYLVSAILVGGTGAVTILRIMGFFVGTSGLA